MADRQKPADKLRFFSDASVAIDGSKFKAVNNCDKNFTNRKLQARVVLERTGDRLEAEVEQLLAPLREPMLEVVVGQIP